MRRDLLPEASPNGSGLLRKCAPLICRELVSARRLNQANSNTNTKAVFQASRVIELTKRIALIARCSEAVGNLDQIDWDTVT
jgi:hypothetical protein